MSVQSNIIKHKHSVTKAKRRDLLAQNSKILWFTGLSGSGKSTIANRVEEILHEKGFTTYLLDGDNVRGGLNNNLGFTNADRMENVRRIGEVSKLFVDAGVIVLAALISPFRDNRHLVRQMVERNEFVEIYINCPIEICEARDTKGLYKKARAGEIKNFTGIDSAYEAPERPDIEIKSNQMDANEAADRIIKFVLKKLELA